MFTVYKKIISPESSPVLGPVMTPINNAPPNTSNDNSNNSNNSNNSAMETLSLCNYCCSPRIKMKNVDDAMQDPMQDPMQGPIKSKYEFGHATHYVYGVTTPRLLCDFETGTPP